MSWNLNIKSKALTIFNWSVMLLMIVLSIWLWLPIITWKTGLLISDHIMNHIIDA